MFRTVLAQTDGKALALGVLYAVATVVDAAFEGPDLDRAWPERQLLNLDEASIDHHIMHVKPTPVRCLETLYQQQAPGELEITPRTLCF